MDHTIYHKVSVTTKKSNLKMEDSTFIIIQLFVVLTVIAGLLSWVVRGLLCKVPGEPAGRVVLVTGCDTGIGHEVKR